ncbi:hypothetical protein RUND412_011083 [Rhizina undulata]
MPLHRPPLLHPPFLQTFAAQYLALSTPCLLPPATLTLPALNWFPTTPPLPNHAHFSSLLGASFTTPVDLESTDPATKNFSRARLPFNLFLEYLCLDAKSSTLPNLYLAQTSLSQLPGLEKDLPTPEIVGKGGRGDVYAVNLWIGRGGKTDTPLHKDPNPNVFAQLAGRKRVRLFSPAVGLGLMERYGGWGSGNGENSKRRPEETGEGGETWDCVVGGRLMKEGDRRFRGEDMMMGFTRATLDSVVWGPLDDDIAGYEAEVGAGEGLFIPMGWWHAVRSIGEKGVSASVNWWFR